MAWNLEHTRGEHIQSSQNIDYGSHYDTVYKRDGYMGGPDYICGGAHTVSSGRHINGSGPSAFGGAREWPHVQLNVSFPVGREDLADLLAEELRGHVDRFLQETQLDPEMPHD